MTAEQKIKQLILLRAKQFSKDIELPELTAENIDQVYDAFDEHEEYEDSMQDARGEIRTSGEETGIECDWSRHYESEAVALQAADGSWVGFVHWHGGGKHGDPGSIDWMESAYDLAVTEEEKKVVVRTFAKVTAPTPSL